MVPTSKVVLDHLLDNVLLINTGDIKALSKAGVKYFEKLDKLDYLKIDTLCQDVTIPMLCWREITGFWMYIDFTSPLYTLIMAMTSDA